METNNETISTRERLAKAISEIGVVEKDKQLKGAVSYAYRSSEAVNAAVHAVVGRNLLLCSHTQKIVADELIKGDNGRTTRRVLLKVNWVWSSPADDTIKCVTYGEGLDPRDKAIQKAFTCAQKDMLVKTFCLSDSEVPDAEENNEPILHDEKTKILTASWMQTKSIATDKGIDGEGLETKMLTKAGVDSVEKMDPGHLAKAIDHVHAMIEKQGEKK
jgi:hypothetical protein